MALPRDRKKSGITYPVPQSGVEFSAQSAGLLDAGEYARVEDGVSGAPSMVGVPVGVFGVMPAGAGRFDMRMGVRGIGPASTEEFASWSPPAGYVAVVDGWMVRYVPDGDGVVEAGDAFCRLRIAGRMEPGDIARKFMPVGSEKGDGWQMHGIVSADEQLTLEVTWNSGFRAEFRWWGSLLLENEMGADFVELQPGIVRVAQ